MKNQKPENIEQAILHFIQGNASIEEHTLVLKWLEDHPEDRKTIFGEKDLWDATRIDSAELKENELIQWQVIQQQINTTPLKIFGFKEILRIAAIVVFAIGLGWMSNSLLRNTIINRNVEMKSVESIRGQIKEIFLADGTHVWLNADSKLTFPSNFTAKTRKVELQGEAFFEVTSNEKNPFLVKTKNHTVKVTGTKFNICEYPEDKIIETTLVEGKVKIISGNFIQDLNPGQQSTFYTETAEIYIGEKDFDLYTTWKDGRYEFRNESVSKIFKIMERWWDVEIEYSEVEFSHEYISGVLRKHKPIKQHFEVINELIPIDYQIDNDNIIVKLN